MRPSTTKPRAKTKSAAKPAVSSTRQKTAASATKQKPAASATKQKPAASAKRQSAAKAAKTGKAAKPPAKATARPSPALRRKADRIAEILEQLYPHPPIPLDHRDPFTLLVAVALSAQCTDVRVNATTPSLFAIADSPAKMADLSVEEIDAIVRPCGLSPTKAKNLREMSRLLLVRHGGEVPGSFEELEALPGVGHKTASVVMSQAFGVPAFPVDTHIHRLAGRWGLSPARNVTEVERDLKALYPEPLWNDLHLQIIYFGRQHCPARNHDPAACPICSFAAPRSAR